MLWSPSQRDPPVLPHCLRRLRLLRSGPAPGKDPEGGKDGWSKAKLPDGRMVWVSAPKNAVEKLTCILVIERKSTSARYFCLKCNSTFFGSKKRIKEHLRGEGKDVKHCTMPLAPDEEATLREDDEQDRGRGPRLQAPGAEGAEGGSSAPLRKRKRPRVQQQQQQNFPDTESPWSGDLTSPGEGWEKVGDPREKLAYYCPLLFTPH
jgi:hypothetical protein